MSHHTMLPARTHSWLAMSGPGLPVQPSRGLGPSAIDSLRSAFPGVLTAEHEQLLRHRCGIDGTPLQYVDFTGQWHDEEALGVFRPCITLAIDAAGRRWIAETSKSEGLPGPVWCVLQDPQVVVYVSENLGLFLELLGQRIRAKTFEGWLEVIDAAARHTWRQRGALVSQSRQERGHGDEVRAWLLQLPRHSRVYDLRSPSFGAGWPYGVAGGAGRLHRCGRELLFAVSGSAPSSRWTQHLGRLARQHVAPLPGIVTFDAGRIARPYADSPPEESSGAQL